jgi:hypothetical protein
VWGGSLWGVAVCRVFDLEVEHTGAMAAHYDELSKNAKTLFCENPLSYLGKMLRAGAVKKYIILYTVTQ